MFVTPTKMPTKTIFQTTLTETNKRFLCTICGKLYENKSDTRLLLKVGDQMEISGDGDGDKFETMKR